MSFGNNTPFLKYLLYWPQPVVWISNWHFYLELSYFKKIKSNPLLKPLKWAEISQHIDLEAFFKDGTPEPADIKSSECVSIEFDHLEKGSSWSEISLGDFQLDDSCGSTSSDDPCIIKLKHVRIKISYRMTNSPYRFLLERKVSVRRYELVMRNPLINLILSLQYMKTSFALQSCL